MNPRVPCRWEDRPQVWAEVRAYLAWFDRHLERLGLAGSPGVARARQIGARIVRETARP